MTWRNSGYSCGSYNTLPSISRTSYCRPYGATSSLLTTTCSSYQGRPDADEVYPGLFVGDAVAAKDKSYLRRMGITHVLNTAEGHRYTQVDTDHIYYRDCPRIKYRGFQLMDMPEENISKYFYSAASFINEAISSGGRVLVHCMMGLSRSATLALAYLMISKHMSLTEALATVRSRRDINPNDGFLRQLQQLDKTLRQSRAAISTRKYSYLF